jgi:membrane-bound lytic murein transglycosylase D
VVIPGENAWSISQKYGLKIKKLLAKNRMKEEKELSQSMVMWLRFIRPANVPVEYKESKVQNMIIKSVPNEIETSRPILPPEDDRKPMENLVAEEAKPNTELIETIYLFEELNDETDFINENSYVVLKKDPERVSEENAGNNLTVQESNEKIYVKKEDLYHIVKSSETLFSISGAHGVNVEELRAWNHLNEHDILDIGQSLLIKKPSGSNMSDKNSLAVNQYKTHTVKQEDTLYSIARQYEISIKELMDLNNKQSFTIKEGEELKIKAIN